MVDADAFDKTHTSVLYYRLKQVDFSGNYTYTQTVSVRNSKTGSASITVYPNPFNSTFSLSIIAKEEGTAEMSIVDVQGKQITSKTMNCTKGLNSYHIEELTNAYNGVYFVRLTINGETAVTRLVKVN